MTPKFTEEEKAVLKKIYKIRAQMQKDMEGMTSAEVVAYINSGAPPRRPQATSARKRCSVVKAN
jgi:hypothetical protein